MTDNSKIEWTHHTFNPWWGCTRVSPGCDHCYAETFAKRLGLSVWGADAPRRTFGDKHWSEPLKWNAAAAKAGERHRVFCASMADVFEGRPEDRPHRLRLWALIMATPNLDWLLLTKRPGAIRKLLERDLVEVADGVPDNKLAVWIFDWLKGRAPENVWLGTTVEDQHRANERIPKLLAMPAVLRFLSVEPLLGPVELHRIAAGDRMHASALQRQRDGNFYEFDTPIDWVIVGGESGPGARPCDLSWIRRVVTDCKAADVPVFVKQLGAVPVTNLVPTAETRVGPNGRRQMGMTADLVKLESRKGGDPDEWPADLRVRQFPKGGAR